MLGRSERMLTPGMQVRTNLHVILCFSPVGEKLRIRARQFPALVNCTSLDWLRPWPAEVRHIGLAAFDHTACLYHSGLQGQKGCSSWSEADERYSRQLAFAMDGIHFSIVCSQLLLSAAVHGVVPARHTTRTYFPALLQPTQMPLFANK